MKNALISIVNIIVIIAMAVPTGSAFGVLVNKTPTPAVEYQSTGLFRTTIHIEQAYDLTRLDKLGVNVLSQQDNRVDLLVSELQLESLSRLGFEPSSTNDLNALVQASEDSVSWLAESLEDGLNEAAALVSEDRSIDEEMAEENDAVLVGIINDLSVEQLSAIQALPGVDNDADGLTDTQEAWWCTDPNNPDTDADGRSDGDEIQALKDWIANRRAVAPGETPWASWPFDPVTCPDKDYDSIPNLAERWELGLNMDLESTDRDKFDDGQEVFGVTYCPGGDYSCGYGDLPRSSDAGYVGQVMPSWVKAPGNHPFVAAFPVPEIGIIPSSIVVEAVTEITTDHEISSGTEVSYSTADTEGTSTSVANTSTWNNWEEVSKTTELSAALSREPNPNKPALAIGTAGVSGAMAVLECGGTVALIASGAGATLAPFTGAKCLASLAGFGISLGWMNIELDEFNKDLIDSQNESNKYDSNSVTGAQYPDDQTQILTDGLDSTNQNRVNSGNNNQYYVSETEELMLQKIFEITYPTFTPKMTEREGRSWGGSQTTTTEKYEEHTITNGEAFSDEESWGTAVAVNSSHAADMRFSYTIENQGMDYAQEISNLAFNIFLNAEIDPIATYFVGPDLGGDGVFRNFAPGETHTFTSSPIQLSLQEMKAIDLGGTLRIVMEDFGFGTDELFYNDALTGNIQIAIEDGMEDGDQSIDRYLLPTYDGDFITDVLQRYFPHSMDPDGDLTAIWTPEYTQEVPGLCVEPQVVGSGTRQAVWCKHALTTADWWNIYTDNLGDGRTPLQETPAVAGATALFRFNKDSDMDGYSDRSEDRLGTDPFDLGDFPKPELLAGLHSLRTDNNVVSTLSLLNTGLYDAYGIEAVMIAPDDSITINNNTVGGSGRVKAGKEVVVGSRILSPEFTDVSWTGTAEPVSGGYFTGGADLTYTFTVSCANPGGCVVGQDDWSLNWSDGTNNGSVAFSNTYQSPNPVDIGTNGLKVSFISGSVFDGDSFMVEARTPRDTFQYTINTEPYTEPIVIVSYNDPQGNHRFMLPSESLDLASPSEDLVPFSGMMHDLNGVEITTNGTFASGSNNTQVVVDNPSGKIILGGHVFLDFIDPDGVVVHEVSSTQDFLLGPNVLDLPWDTASFDPAYDPEQDYIVMAFWTDYEGNILDASGRPLSSFQEDPQPDFSILAADEVWDFGSAQQGTVMKRDFSFANLGERVLLTYVDAPIGLDVSQTGSKRVAPADIAEYEITLDTNALPVGAFSEEITIHTSDISNPTKTILVTGTITEGAVDTPASSIQLPLDYAVTVPGPQTQGTWYNFAHPIGPDPQTIHPVEVYSEDYSKLWGMGKYAYDFSTGTGGFSLFGDGRLDDLLVVTGQTKTISSTRTNITANGTNATVTSSSGFSVGDLVLIHQTQGTSNVGKYEYAFISSISGSSWVFTDALTHSYSNVSAKAQVIKVPQYKNVTVQSGGTLTAPTWNGSTGGILVFKASGTLTINGQIRVTGIGYQGGAAGSFEDPVKSQGWQGYSYIAGSRQSRSTNLGGGGGGQGDDGSRYVGAGGGGGGYGTSGVNGQSSESSYGGYGGNSYGDTSLARIYFGSGGGGGGSDDNDNGPGGSGGYGGGILLLGARKIQINGYIYADGRSGGQGNEAYRTGGGGGGAGGSILMQGAEISLGINKVLARGGAGGPGTDKFGTSPDGGDGGNGGVGRIAIEHCGLISGSTSPAARTSSITCHIAEQVESSPYTTTRLQIPETFSTTKTYALKYGRRLVFSGSGNQTTSLRIPAGLLALGELDFWISDVGVGTLTISMDIGNDGTTDYTYTGTMNNLAKLENIQFTNAYNLWWSANSKQLRGEIDVPVKINLSKAGKVLLTDLKISTAGSSLGYIRLESTNYESVIMDYALLGTSGALSVALDVGDDGTIDDVYVYETPDSPQNVTSSDLSASINTFLDGQIGEVDVPVRFYISGCSDAQLVNYLAIKSGTYDIILSASDINLPESDPMETELVPISVNLHNAGQLPSGNFTAAFFASSPEIGEWYIGSAFIPGIEPGQTALGEILWDSSGFTGLMAIKVYADPYFHIDENDEENNQAEVPIYVRTRPDLLGTTILPFDNEPTVNESINVSVMEKNEGETDASLSSLSLYDGDPDDSGLLVGQQESEVIGGSETQLDFDWTPTTTGWHRLYAMADVNEQVDEYNEANNLTWKDIYVGFQGPLLVDSGTASDAIYSESTGYGYLDINQPDQLGTCGSGDLPEETYRRDPDGTVLYQFDHLLPGHFYHLDITMFECDGSGRQQYVLIDDNQVAGPEDLGDGQVHRLSLRIDPAFYADRAITVAIHADGIDGAVVSEVNLHDIDYRYADAGGGADPQYPGDQEFGWLDGSAVTSWGTLPYQSVRVDQTDAEINYRFDNLDPGKSYNLHFTFWQPSGTGRVQKVQIDGIDTSLVVNTDDYLKHQEKLAVPLNTYSTDGSIVVSIVRINALAGAMVNEIALEEETITINAGCEIQETPYFTEAYGAVLIQDIAAPVGSVVQAVSPRGNTVGCFTVSSAGDYGFMRIYGEDSSATPIIPGMRAGEIVSFRVNGAPAIASPMLYWSDDHASHNVDLNAGNLSGQSILLQPGWNLVSFNVEPPVSSVSSVLQSVNGRYDRVLGETGVYSPSLSDPFNTLKEMHFATGYYIRVVGTVSVNLLVQGIEQPCSTPKELHAGWNWIGAPCSAIPTATALQNIDGYYQRVLSLNKTYDPALPQYSTLQELTPGEGYLIYITEPVTLIYPDETMQNGENDLTRTDLCGHVSPTPFATIIYGQININGNAAPSGTIVEVVTPRGEIAGCGVIIDDGLLPFTQVYGADVDGNIGGFFEGEELSLRINGIDIPEQPDFQWEDDKDSHWIEVNAEIEFDYEIYLPIMTR